MTVNRNKKFDWDILVLCIIFVVFLWVNRVTEPETKETGLNKSELSNQETVISTENETGTEEELSIIEELMSGLIPNYFSKNNNLKPDEIVEELRPKYMTDTTKGNLEDENTSEEKVIEKKVIYVTCPDSMEKIKIEDLQKRIEENKLIK